MHTNLSPYSYVFQHFGQSFTTISINVDCRYLGVLIIDQVPSAKASGFTLTGVGAVRAMASTFFCPVYTPLIRDGRMSAS